MVGVSPTVTCMVMTYNEADFIVQAVESILAQDYPADALQIVVVDNASQDSTPERLRPYLDRIRSVRLEQNTGLMGNFSRAMAEATGEFIAYLCGDDVWLPDRVRRQVSFLQAHPQVGLVYGDLQVIDRSGTLVAPSFWRATGIEPRRGQTLGPLLSNNCATSSSIMVRGSLKHRLVPVRPEAIYDDWWSTVQVAAVAELDYLPDPIIQYRSHGQNMLFGASGPKLFELLRREVPFRRWLLTTHAYSEVRPDDLLAAYLIHENQAIAAAKNLELPLADVIAVTADDRAAAEALNQEALGAYRQQDHDQTFRHLVAALARDPWHPAVRANMGFLLQGAGHPDVAQRFQSSLHH